MIINLTGNIASGKTTFVKWFVERHPEWIHLDIATYRKILKTENLSWAMLGVDLLGYIRSDNNIIIESTGTIYRLGQIWEEACGVGIYTIVFDTPAHICKQRSEIRDPERSSFECYCIDYEEIECMQTPVNLLVKYKKDQDTKELYSQIEDKILEVEKLLQQTTAEVL